MHSLSLEPERLGMGTAVFPILGNKEYQYYGGIPDDISVFIRVLTVSKNFAHVGEGFAKKLAPTDKDPIDWFWVEWLERPLDFLGGRSPWDAVKSGEEHLVLHYLKLASN